MELLDESTVHGGKIARSWEMVKEIGTFLWIYVVFLGTYPAYIVIDF